MRKVIQTLSLLLFTLLFALATYRLPEWLPADIYLRIDPLLGIDAAIASREIIGRVLWSLVLIGATLAVGRFFCAYVCPLGACLDGLDFLLFRKAARPDLKAGPGLRQVKYLLLILILAAALTGVSAGLSPRPDRASDPVLHLCPLSPGGRAPQSRAGSDPPPHPGDGMDRPLPSARFPSLSIT